jgi:hypothetical protein
VRDSAALASVVGYFVNPLPLRADLSGNPSFVELLARVRRTVLDAFAHQDFPFALLVERLQPERDPSRSPLFQHMFVMQQSGSIGSGQLAPTCEWSRLRWSNVSRCLICGCRWRKRTTRA